MSDNALRLGEPYAPTLASQDAASQIHPDGYESRWTRPALTDVDAFRRESEQELADAVLSLDELVRSHPEATDAHLLFKWEINGMCLLLRGIGGYGSQNFDVEWARAVRARNADQAEA